MYPPKKAVSSEEVKWVLMRAVRGPAPAAVRVRFLAESPLPYS